MLKIAKYYVLANIYKRSKFSIILIVVLMTGMVLTSFIFSDLLSMSDGSSRILLIGMKWLILFALLGVIGYHLRKIFKSISLPFAKESEVDEKRVRVMAKTKLHSRSERILEKYRSGQ